MVNQNEKALRRSGRPGVGELGRTEPGVQAFLESRGSTNPRTWTTYREHFGMIRRRAPRPLLELSVAEARKLAADLKATGSARILCGVLRMFYQHHDRPDLVKLFKIKAKPLTIDKDALVTDDEVNALLANVEFVRDAALIGAMFECGVRVSEITAVRLRDVELMPSQENGGKRLAKVWFRRSKIEGEQHSFTLVDSAELVAKWMELYPLPRQGGESPLFPSSSRHNYGGFLTRPGVDGILKSVARRAGLNPKKFHAHAARHFAATRLLRSGMTDSMVKKSLGWRPASAMLSRYSHVVSQDAEDAYLRSRGLSLAASSGPKAFGAPPTNVPLMPSPPPEEELYQAARMELETATRKIEKRLAALEATKSDAARAILADPAAVAELKKALRTASKG